MSHFSCVNSRHERSLIGWKFHKSYNELDWQRNTTSSMFHHPSDSGPRRKVARLKWEFIGESTDKRVRFHRRPLNLHFHLILLNFGAITNAIASPNALNRPSRADHQGSTWIDKKPKKVDSGDEPETLISRWLQHLIRTLSITTKLINNLLVDSTQSKVKFHANWFPICGEVKFLK